MEDIEVIEFSKNGEGKVLMRSDCNSVYLGKVNHETRLGEEVDTRDKDVELMYELRFYKTESIDILIRKLNEVKQNMMISSAS